MLLRLMLMVMQGRTIDVRRHGLTSTASTDFGSVRNLDFEEGSARAKRRGRSLKRAVGIHLCSYSLVQERIPKES